MRVEQRRKGAPEKGDAEIVPQGGNKIVTPGFAGNGCKDNTVSRAQYAFVKPHYQGKGVEKHPVRSCPPSTAGKADLPVRVHIQHQGDNKETDNGFEDLRIYQHHELYADVRAD